MIRISACDSLSNLNLFPGLQTDQRVCGPNPREFFSKLEPGQDPEACLQRFQRRVANRVPPSIVIRSEDVTRNIVEACSRKKWVQLNLCKDLQVEEARVTSTYGSHKRLDKPAGQDNEVSDDDDDAEPDAPPLLKRPAVGVNEAAITRREVRPG